jgi:plasmid stabilization system protein ParE
MVRRITWSGLAEKEFNNTLHYYAERNKSKTYSKKLSKEIKKHINLLSSTPHIGKESDFEYVHVSIKGHFKIFYNYDQSNIIILLVWDTRQNPEKLLKLLKS